MSFIKLEDHAKKGSSEYFIRTELIREVDIERDEQGQITTMDVYLMDGNYEVREDSRFSFEREERPKLTPFFTRFSPLRLPWAGRSQSQASGISANSGSHRRSSLHHASRTWKKWIG